MPLEIREGGRCEALSVRRPAYLYRDGYRFGPRVIGWASSIENQNSLGNKSSFYRPFVYNRPFAYGEKVCFCVVNIVLYSGKMRILKVDFVFN